MVRPELTKWNQSVSDLRRLSIESVHPRTRERFLALYMIASGQTSAQRWAQETGRMIDTVLRWLHGYNKAGPEAMVYRRTGGRPPLSWEQVVEMSSTVRESEPLQHGLPGHGWTVKKIVCHCLQRFGLGIGHTTFQRYLKQNRLSWKKCQKVLGRANGRQRAHYMQEFQELFAQVCNDKVRLLYLDESHFHRDLQVGYTWAATGLPAWRRSDCPPLSDRINCYGAYDFSAGRCFIWQEGGCNQQQTVTFLQHLISWLGESTLPVVLVWDGAPWHRAHSVRTAAAALGLTIKQLPAYSPDLNPIEGLWKWLRSEVTQHHCYPTTNALFAACQAFVQRINTQPLQLVDRLWPKLELDPDYEKLLMSN